MTVYGKDAVVVVSVEEFDRLKSRSEASTLHGLLVNSPLRRMEFGEARVKGPVREIDL